MLADASHRLSLVPVLPRNRNGTKAEIASWRFTRRAQGSPQSTASPTADTSKLTYS